MNKVFTLFEPRIPSSWIITLVIVVAFSFTLCV